jgi:DNA-binding GntR family transcriptional regulator
MAAEGHGRAVVDDLTEALREAILSGTLAPGSWLRQEHIAQQYGVSRTPVREALRALQAQNMVDVVPHQGTRVSGPTLRDIREGYAVRAELEAYAASLAAELASDDQIERMRQAESLFVEAVEHQRERAEDAGDGRPRWSAANDRFHEAVLEAAGNRRLAEMIQVLHSSFPRNVTWPTLHGNSHLLQENVDQHGAVLAAIVEHDSERAAATMREHVLRSGELIARRFERLQEESVRGR